MSCRYQSVAAAFRALKLSLTKHRGFRLQLVRAGRATFEHDGKQYLFRVLI
jgi:hypothetical protein